VPADALGGALAHPLDDAGGGEPPSWEGRGFVSSQLAEPLGLVTDVPRFNELARRRQDELTPEELEELYRLRLRRAAAAARDVDRLLWSNDEARFEAAFVNLRDRLSQLRALERAREVAGLGGPYPLDLSAWERGRQRRFEMAGLETGRHMGQAEQRAAEQRLATQQSRVDVDAAAAHRNWEAFLETERRAVPEAERSVVENEQFHQELRRRARSEEATAFETEQVIGDPNQTFGVEIEFDGADPNVVARALYDAGLVPSPHQQPYHGPRQEGMWALERDVTVTGEVVSPILRDTPESWEQLRCVCEILQAHGARTTTRTGGHVHVGCDSANLDHDVDQFRRVARVCAWSEDLIYRLAAATGSRGRSHRGGRNGYQWCGPMRGNQRFENANSLEDLSYRVGNSHGVGLNFGNITNSRRTIEYRYFDATLDPVRLQANVKLACWITKRAGSLGETDIPDERVPLGSHASPRDPDDGDRLLRRFADTIFVRPRDKLKLYWMYEHTNWQRTRRGPGA